MIRFGQPSSGRFQRVIDGSAAGSRRETARRIERLTGEFRRRFRLPDLADAQNIKAKSVNGVLEIAIPKLAREKPRRIAAEAA
jgi:HSP20 family molecular chaperone IbpA